MVRGLIPGKLSKIILSKSLENANLKKRLKLEENE